MQRINFVKLRELADMTVTQISAVLKVSIYTYMSWQRWGQGKTGSQPSQASVEKIEAFMKERNIKMEDVL